MSAPWAVLRLCEDVTPSTESNCAPIVIEVTGEQFTIGRRPGVNDCVLNNQCISSLHCILSFVTQASANPEEDIVRRQSTTSKAICIADMSTNGIYVNNMLVGKGKTIHLKSGDQIELVRAAKQAFSRFNLVYSFVMAFPQDWAPQVEEVQVSETQRAPEPTGLLALTERSSRERFEDLYHVFQDCRLGSGSFASVFKSCRVGSEKTGPFFAVKIIDRQKKLPPSDFESLFRFFKISERSAVSVLDMPVETRTKFSVEDLDNRIIEELFSMDDNDYWEDETKASGRVPTGFKRERDADNGYRGEAAKQEENHKRLVSMLSAQKKAIYEKCLVEKLRWDRETIILRNISHPGLVSTFDVFHSAKTIEFVLEFAEGGTMLSALTNNGPLSELSTKVITFELLTAISYLHKRGIVHRDIKLENILLAKPFSVPQFHIESISQSKRANPSFVSSNAYADDFSSMPPEGTWPEAKLTDFGLSRVLGFDTSTMTTMCGTLLYAAPEVTHTRLREDASGYTAAVDIYSLGVVAFALLMERPPFQHDRDRHGQVMKDRMNYTTPINWHRKPRASDNSLPLTPISDKGKDLLGQMLAIRPCDRITAEKALCHPWFDDIPASARVYYRS